MCPAVSGVSLRLPRFAQLMARHISTLLRIILLF